MTTIMHCNQFDELLPDYLEETLAPDARQHAETHLRSCVRCTGLVGDLRDIRSEAANLPALSPSRDLWAGIAARIESPVVAIGSRPSATAAPRRINRGWLAAAALLLMTLSSGTTYWMTRGPAAAGPAQVALAPAAPTAVIPRNDVAATTILPSAAVEPGMNRSAPAPTQRRLRSVTRSLEPSLEVTYEREVVALRRILTERSTELDPKTVAILEASLRMIDQAILQSRNALAADPASGFLRDQLNKALDRKVEVLRTAAMLPART